jgi:hypothetical protein
LDGEEYILRKCLRWEKEVDITAWDQIFMAIISFLCFMFFHILIWQNKRIQYRGLYLMLKVTTISYLMVGMLGVYLCSLPMQDHVWVSVPLHFCLFMLYIHLYVGIDKSVSVRIMGELVTRPKKRLTYKELDNLYSPRIMVQARLNLLVEKGWLKENNGKYECLSKAKKLVKLNLFIKKMFLLEQTG